MATTTARLALTQPVGTDAVSELRTSITGNATALDSAAIYQEGTLAARPMASSVAHGTFYRATDTGDLSWSNGTAWTSVCQLPASGVAQYAQGTFAARPAAGVAGRVYYATDTGVFYQDTGSAWLTVMIAGAWQNLTLASGIAAATGPTPAGRREGGDVVRLQGWVQASTSVVADAALFTLPAALIPSHTKMVAVVRLVGSSESLVPLSLGPTSGLCSVNVSLNSGDVIALDGAPFTLA